MKFVRNLSTLFCVLIWLTACAGSQWEKGSVSGSQGSVMEIRLARSSPARQPTPQKSAAQQLPPAVAAQVEAQTGQNRLQEEFQKRAAQLTAASSSKDYKVGPEDLLAVNFLDADKLNTEARVNGQGEIRLLLVGDVKVAGLTPEEAAKELTRLYRAGDFLKNPQITVSVKEFRHLMVSVTGAVKTPNQYALIGPRTLLEVLGMAGGLSDTAGEAAYIIRAQGPSGASQAAAPQEPFSPGSQTIVVDLNRLLLKGAAELNLPIQNGDVVHVPFARTAYVLGAVNKPGSVLLKDNMTLTKAIAQSGGLMTLLASDNATVLRLDENGERLAIPVNIAQITKGKAEDMALKENDVVFVQESSTRRFMYDFKAFLPGSFGASVPIF